LIITLLHDLSRLITRISPWKDEGMVERTGVFFRPAQDFGWSDDIVGSKGLFASQ